MPVAYLSIRRCNIYSKSKQENTKHETYEKIKGKVMRCFHMIFILHLFINPINFVRNIIYTYIRRLDFDCILTSMMMSLNLSHSVIEVHIN
jgi:hypothetical protein